MVNQLLRQYERWECLGDGYPQAWHRSTVRKPVPGGPCETTGCGGTILSPIKDLIREQADHRCLRCLHPYRKGDVRISAKGEWSPCSIHCLHEGPLRWHYDDGTVTSVITDMLTIVATLGPPGEERRKTFEYAAFHPEAQWRILTVHHLDEDKSNCRWWNLAALCQRCHLRMQRAVVMDRPWHYEHSDWFKPYAAGFYAWKYLGEDLGREETLQRLPELLALEHRFTQEALL